MIIIILISLIISTNFAILGCVSMWKNHISFVDGIAHASILTAIIILATGFSPTISGIILSVIFAFLVFKLQDKAGSNIAIHFIANLAIAISLVLSYKYSKVNLFQQVLVGEILAADSNDLVIASLNLIAIISFIAIFYRPLIIIALNKDMAYAVGIKVKALELAFAIVLAVSIFLSLQIIGALLVVGLCLIPPLTARLITQTPINMILVAILTSIVATLISLALSYYWDIPITSTVVLVNATIYLLLKVSVTFLSR